MFSVADFLDRAKRGAGVDSDYALAKRLGHSNQANVSGWRKGRVAPDGRAILALCELSGDDPEHVAACIQSMRAANDDEAGLWRRVADRLKQHGANVIAAPLIAMFLIAAFPDEVRAATASPAFDVASVCILCQTIVRLARRLASLLAVTARRARLA